jgi:hypothetical protein
MGFAFRMKSGTDGCSDARWDHGRPDVEVYVAERTTTG